MQTIFLICTDNPDNEAIFHGFRSTLGLAIKRCTEILEKVNYDGAADVFIEEYALDGDLPNVDRSVYGATDKPIATYNRSGIKFPK